MLACNSLRAAALSCIIDSKGCFLFVCPCILQKIWIPASLTIMLHSSAEPPPQTHIHTHRRCSMFLQSKADQGELRALRGELNAVRAELHEAQEHLVEARSEESKKRQLAEKEAEEGDKRLSESQQPQSHCCMCMASMKLRHAACGRQFKQP